MDKPVEISLEEGKQYYWCTCGFSRKDPFCDGSHKKQAVGKKSHPFVCDKAEKAWLCTCKKTNTPPYCDGSHKELCDD